jgi:hypothetical protein
VWRFDATGRCLATDDLRDPVETSADAARHVAGTKLREHLGPDDLSSHPIRKDALQTVADFDVAGSLAQSDEQQHAAAVKTAA